MGSEDLTGFMSLLSQKGCEYAEALIALGLDPRIVVLPSSCEGGDSHARPSPDAGRQPRAMALEPALPTLADAEWEIVRDHLPAKPAQADAIGNRAFLAAVLWVFAQRRAWTQVAGDHGEAVRKRFARWAHAGHWQRLRDAVGGRGLSALREAQLTAVARRAGQLQARLRRG